MEPGDMIGRTRYARVSCPDCRGSGVRGEPVPDVVCGVDEDGVARRLVAGEGRERGEALHEVHRCAQAPAAA
jgi:hypothetical protein